VSDRLTKIKNGWPVPYLVDEHAEFHRLLRDIRGYLCTCKKEHHGTDWEGRKYAIEALETLIARTATP
jgi:hypothetical protein